MSISEPFFSVIIPTYNRALFIKECIESVLSQNFYDYEVIVVDDGSTDNTEKVLYPYEKKIKYITQPNRGPEEARNQGILSSRGKYIAFLDSDDILFPYALRIYYEVIQRDSPSLLISTAKFFRNKFEPDYIPTLKKIEYYKSRDYLSKKYSVWLSNTVLVVKRELVIGIKIFFSPGLIDDLDFILKAGTLSPFVYITNPPTVGYRIHSSNSIHNVKVNLKGLSLIINKEKKGEYAGGKKRKIERAAVIGGHAQWWIRKGFSEGYYKETLLLLLKSFFILGCAFTRKIWTTLLKVKDKKVTIEINMRN
ncbi:MAG: glycosyltransferase [Chitinispirillaceae bacterium]|nr:glycosyltransferase [Chitinispirillaceae bacterium]